MTEPPCSPQPRSTRSCLSESNSLDVRCVPSSTHGVKAEPWTRIADYAIFASHDFNPNDYAHAVLAGEPYPSQSASKPKAKLSVVEPAKEDISVAITKLNSGIDDISKQLKNVVSPLRSSGSVSHSCNDYYPICFPR